MPTSEVRRLEALRALQILDTDPEESFDQIAKLAARIFRAPISQVSLVDEHREWFKTSWGIKEREGDRRTAFCAHTILEERVLVVEDTSQDERFCDNPRVTTDPGIRFYAGAPIHSPSGLRVGALCIKDYRPRTFSTEESHILEMLASLIDAEMEHRLVAGELLKWKHIFDHADWGVVVGSADGETVELMNACFARMHGYTLEELSGMPTLALFPPQVRDTVVHQIQTVNERGHHVFESVHVRRDGTEFPVQVDATAVRDERGRLLYRAAHVQDITERKRTEEALQRSHSLLKGVMESTSDVVFIKDSGGRYLMMNTAGLSLLNRPLSEILGRDDFELFPPDLAERLRADDRRVLAGQEVQEVEQLVLAHGGPRIVMTKKCAWVDEKGRVVGVIGIARDVTEREWAEKELRRLRVENVYLREEARSELEFGEIVGSSGVMDRLLDQVRQVASSDSTVLITGETGTGKELIARAIHESSTRRDRVLVKVNCAALPGSLIESELFGHEKGAFTGALTQKIGRFEMADKGTIFLDEVGDLPLELQAKFLRVLQEGEFERVGSAKTLKVDVRVIAATNRDLETEAADGRFRADLFYRLNVFPMRVPPLRERVEDIPLLASHFAMKHATRMGRRIESIPKGTIGALTAYPWPGNVRELQNVIERAVILSPGGSLRIGDWPPARPRAGEDPFTLTLEEAERRHIILALERTKWRVSGPNGAADVLGLKPTTLHARMKKLGIRKPT